MTGATQGNGGPDGRPLCFNGQPPQGYAANDGWTSDGRLKRRTIPWAFAPGCKSWKADPSTDPVPMAEGWRCGGCAHFPVELAAEAVVNRLKREGLRA